MSEAQISIPVAVSFGSTILTIFLGLYVTLAKYALSQRDREIDRRLDEQHTQQLAAEMKCNDVALRLMVEEKATIRQDGDMNLLKQTHSQVSDDLADLKATIVTKQEFQAWAVGVERLLNDIRAQNSGRTTYSPKPTPGQGMQVPRIPSK